ncbi:MAG TPA: FecR domain-containing protein [Turneriella sp.]|nr:FecR domain-containing protein [Turneriella sp.]
MRIKQFYILLTGTILLTIQPKLHAVDDKPKELLAVALNANGECFYERDGKTQNVRIKTIFFKNDRLFTKNGKMNIQIGPNAVLHLSPYGTVRLNELNESEQKIQIVVSLDQGRGYTKFTKPMKPGSKYQIRTPTITAGVRGTEFIISAGDTPENTHAEDADIPAGVYVNHGKVAVATVANESAEQEVPAGEQVTGNDELIKGVLDDFVKKKMAMFKRLNTMREEQYRMLENEKRRQMELLEKVRSSRNFENRQKSFEELKKRNNSRFK